MWSEPSVLADWPVADLCEWCGHLHGGGCPSPVTEPPSGLVTADMGLTPLGAVVHDAAKSLAMRGYLDADAGECPDWVLSELAELYQGGPCESCPGPLNGTTLADHFLDRKQEAYERWVPTWTCECGRKFKVLREPPGIAFYEPRGDGLLGDIAGYIKPDSKRRKVKHSDLCPGCTRRFADAIAGQLNPQQALF